MVAIASVLAHSLEIYLWIIVINIILNWIFLLSSIPLIYELNSLLNRLVSPYLNLFRRFRIFTLGPLDLSPIAGIIVLQLLINFLRYVGLQGVLSLKIILVFLLQGAWQIAQPLLTLLFIILVIRLIWNTFTTSKGFLGLAIDSSIYATGQKLARRIHWPSRSFHGISILLILAIILSYTLIRILLFFFLNLINQAL